MCDLHSWREEEYDGGCYECAVEDNGRLRAENEKLKEQIKGDTMAHDGLVKMVDEYEAKLKVAVEALKPFARLGEMIPKLNKSYHEILYAWHLKHGEYEITKTMFTDAKQALAKIGGDDE